MPDRPPAAKRLRVATRGSNLALRQSDIVAQALRSRGWSVDILPLTTSGDRRQRQPPQQPSPVSKDAFVKEVQAAVLGGQADLAVHSLKDMPLRPHPGLQLAAVGRREDCADVLVTPGNPRNMDLASLPPGARIGTSSLRRQALLRRFAPQAQPAAVRGNVDTRLQALREGQCQGLVLAAAGLNRLGLAANGLRLDLQEWLPAPGQGAIAVEMPAGHPDIQDVAAAFEHRPTNAAITAERALAGGLGVDCNAPLGALAQTDGRRLSLRAFVASPDGGNWLAAQAHGAPGDAEGLGRSLARRMLARGAAEILALAGSGHGDA